MESPDGVSKTTFKMMDKEFEIDVKEGQWILVEHGRWTRGVDLEDSNGNTITIRRVEPASVMMSSDERPADTTVAY